MTLKRIKAQPGLSVVTWLSLTVFFMLVITIPLYTDAVYQRSFKEKIQKHTTGDTGLPFLYSFDYYGLWSDKSEWEDIELLDGYLTSASSEVLKLPIQRLVRIFKSDYFDLMSGQSASSVKTVTEFGSGDGEKTKSEYNNDQKLSLVDLGFVSGIENNILLVEGKFPQLSSADATDPIEVLVSLQLANEVGLQPGEVYHLTSIKRTEKENNQDFPIRISGIWQPKDPDDPYWTFPINSLDDTLLTSQANYTTRIIPNYDREITQASWYVILDGSQVTSDQVDSLLDRVEVFEKTASGFFRSFRIVRSPRTDLIEYQQAAQHLRISLYAFALPIYGLMLAFIVMISGLAIEGRRNEIAVTRSRGASTWQALGMIGLENLIIGSFALAASLPAAMMITLGIGLTRSFMDFESRQALSVQWSRSAINAGFLALALALVVSLLPALRVVGDTIISYKRDRARQMTPPIWQKLWLDFLLLIPAGYGAFVLSRQGSLFILQRNSSIGPSDPLGDPLLFLVPSLCVFAFSLILLRILHHLLAGLAWLLAKSPFTGLLLAIRQLARTRTYQTPLLILIFTLSLSIYTASLAKTLDQHLMARTYYQVGGEVTFLKVGREQIGGFGPGSTTQPKDDSLSFPVNEFLKITGIDKAIRVGSYPAYASQVVGGYDKGRFLGVDRIEFPDAAFWRY